MKIISITDGCIVIFIICYHMYRTCIAHGMWGVSRCLATIWNREITEAKQLLDDINSAKRTVLEVHFRKPLFLGSRVECTIAPPKVLSSSSSKGSGIWKSFDFAISRANTSSKDEIFTTGKLSVEL